MDTKELSRIMLPSEGGYSFYDIKRIIRCEATSEGTLFYIQEESKPIIVQIPIARYEVILSDVFYKVNHNSLINLNYVQRYFTQKESYIEMKDGSKVKVIEKRKEELLKKLKGTVNIY